jgi:hypothetical protein
MSSFIFNSTIEDTFAGRINFFADNFSVLLLTDEYRPDKESHSRRSDVDAFEVDGANYSLGGQSAEVDVRIGDEFQITLGEVKWPMATISARYAVYVHDSGGGPDADELVALIDFKTMVNSTNATFTLEASTLTIGA